MCPSNLFGYETELSQYQSVNVTLSDFWFIKLKSAAKNETDVILMLSQIWMVLMKLISYMLLTNRQVSSLHNVFAYN